MTDQSDISGFWAKGYTLGRILDALDEAGLSLDNLSILDLAPVDHLHARGLPATVDLADRLPIEHGQHILDIGCAVGGPARYMAGRFSSSPASIKPGVISIPDTRHPNRSAMYRAGPPTAQPMSRMC